MKKISTSTLQRPMVICLLAAFCCLLWGSAFPAVKIGYGLLSISSADSAEQLIFDKRNAYKILSLARLPVPTLPHIAFLGERFLSRCDGY